VNGYLFSKRILLFNTAFRIPFVDPAIAVVVEAVRTGLTFALSPPAGRLVATAVRIGRIEQAVAVIVQTVGACGSRIL
jgi:hypothetical protein